MRNYFNSFFMDFLSKLNFSAHVALVCSEQVVQSANFVLGLRQIAHGTFRRLFSAPGGGEIVLTLVLVK